MVHCDVKPDNLCLKQGGGVCLVDFGLARKPNESSSFAGSTYYCSVNMHRRVSQGGKDDFHQLFYTCCYLLNGPLPWMDQSLKEEQI